MLSPATFGMAQTIIVKDSITHEAVPFVSLNFGNDTGGYTDENGAIAIPNEAAQIRLSHICYETKSISKITADLQTIFLVPKSINLDEVAISAKALKRTKTTEVGSMKAKTQTKQLIGYSKQNRHTLIILDEILKGTNSLDKLNGSRLFLQSISDLPVTGIVATHDLELSKIQQESPDRFHNYCFEIQLSDEITYTYRITEGVARNQNATYLLKNILKEQEI